MDELDFIVTYNGEVTTNLYKGCSELKSTTLVELEVDEKMELSGCIKSARALTRSRHGSSHVSQATSSTSKT